ncbi:uncharacterized protein YbjT (DUF2867 family) [Anseongella ginsenosidimutans]|uniref:Uncharacterized protein YbjT (DUF2867 family) n=1 Tax=Anseongella ginsenosidimutans TaxID=496056 RepID=A0A4R3KU64_9SPHI|nr:NAD-dependent epimerase/dehydratase family protein [Anseongella ginsenosidimutans]QEC51589.1 NAD-dependent epimerase/dehydratase family protein [Anseongella ginsenosidimutans]TCS88917.1 uncharacterized protein YbjT (DUF2867 family) [Anseongella ginsenosidimutans]
MSTVLLTGATGLVGRICLDLLLQDPYFKEVRVISRRPLYHEDPKLKEFITDFNNLESLAGEFEAEIVICCLGSTIKDAGSREQFMKIDHDYPVQIAQIAHRKGSRHFMVISSIGASKSSLFFYSRVKGMMEDNVKMLPYESISIFQPSLIDGERKEVRVMEQLSLKMSRPLGKLLQGSLKKYRPIAAQDIARAIIHAAKNNLPGIHYYTGDKIKDCSDRYSL